MASRSADIRFQRLPERDLLAVGLFGEARGEPIEGQVGVLNVFRNRLDIGRWGPTYHRVLLQWAQFSCFWPTLSSELAYKRVVEFAEHLTNGGTGRTRGERQLLGLVDLLLADALVDNTRGSGWYYALTKELIQDRPGWAKTGEQTVVLGRHVFFRNVK